MTGDYNHYDFKDAVKIIKDANLKLKNKEYAIAAYSAYVAKEVFAKMNNPLGVYMCEDLINLAIGRIRSKAMDELISEGQAITPSKISNKIRTLKDVLDLGELLNEEVKASRLSLDEMAEVYCRLVDGDRVDPVDYINCSKN